MGVYYDRIAALREERAATVAALDEIEKGAIITRNGIDLTERQRRFHQNVLSKIDALVAAYENIDAPWA
ncbi:MAG: hypothetical protein ABSF49_11125 [Roseiarcus sp.]|uniref:hypothetical protein n=1 Tax=Roseiarcus sp. TaxID=1969460 RepID=UPI003C1B4C3B